MAGLLVALVVVTFAQVVFRYVLHAPLAWSEELARFLLMWLASLSAAYAFKRNSHFALRVLVDRCSKRVRQGIGLFATLGVASFLLIFALQSLRFTLEVRGMSAPATQMSMSIPYASVFVGAVLMLYYVVAEGWRQILDWKVD